MKAFKLEADMYAGSTRQARQPAAASEGDARWHCSAEVGNNTDARLQIEEHRSTSDVLAAVDVPCGALEPTRSLPLSYAECRCRLPCREQGQ